MKSYNRDQAQSCLSAAILNKQPINNLPSEASELIAVAIGNAGQPPPPEQPDQRIPEFISWFQSLYRELHPSEADLSLEELNEHWNAFVMHNISEYRNAMVEQTDVQSQISSARSNFG